MASWKPEMLSTFTVFYWHRDVSRITNIPKTTPTFLRWITSIPTPPDIALAKLMNVSPSCAQSYYHSSHLSKQPELFSAFLERKTGFSSVVTFSRQSNRLLVENRRWVGLYIISSLESTPGSFCQPHEHQSYHFPIHLRMPVRPSSSLSPLSCIHNVTPIIHSSSPAWKRTSSTDPSCHHHRLLVPFGLRSRIAPLYPGFSRSSVYYLKVYLVFLSRWAMLERDIGLGVDGGRVGPCDRHTLGLTEPQRSFHRWVIRRI